MHELSEKTLGVRRRNDLANWDSEGMVRECWKEDNPYGFSQMVEFEKLFNIHRVFSLEACHKYLDHLMKNIVSLKRFTPTHRVLYCRLNAFIYKKAL